MTNHSLLLFVLGAFAVGMGTASVPAQTELDLPDTTEKALVEERVGISDIRIE